MRLSTRITILASVVITLALLGPATGSRAESDRVAIAERYFRGIYGGDASVVDELASADIVVSYPILEALFGQSAIRGREAVKAFVNGFAKKWEDPRFEFHETVSEGNSVVLVWSFQARMTSPASGDQQLTGETGSWGGITLIRFDDEGRISAEIGEESEPGPIERLENSDDR